MMLGLLQDPPNHRAGHVVTRFRFQWAAASDSTTTNKLATAAIYDRWGSGPGTRTPSVTKRMAF
jgi:hypothetical protein